MKNSITLLSILLSVITSNVLGAPAATADDKEAGALQKLKTGDRLESMQNELQKLETALKHYRQQQQPSEPTRTEVSSPVKATEDSRDVAPQGGFQQPQRDRNGVYYDQPVDRLYERQIGWQPLKKRLVGWQPMKRNQAGGRFRLTLPRNQQLRTEMIGAIEQHLMDDLQAAREFGIEPSQILQDLRQRRQPSTRFAADK